MKASGPKPGLPDLKAPPKPAPLATTTLAQSRVAASVAAMGMATSAVLPPLLNTALRQQPDRSEVNTRTFGANLSLRTEQNLLAAVAAQPGEISLETLSKVVANASQGLLSVRPTLELIDHAERTKGLSPEARAFATDLAASLLRHASLPAPIAADAIVASKPVAGLLVDPVHGANVVDVKQGNLSNCYFVAAAAAVVARDPHFVNRIVSPMDVGGERAYSVKLHRTLFNVPMDARELTVSSRVWSSPTHPDQPMYAQQPTQAHWMQVLESAAAQLHGSYSKTELGFGFSALATLTGKAAGYHAPTDAASLFASLKGHVDAGFAVTTGTHVFGDAAFISRSGHNYVAAHEYAVLSMSGNDASDAVVTLYNPHGKQWDVSMSDLARNFLGYSYVDLNAPDAPTPQRLDEPWLLSDQRRRPKPT